MLPDDHPDRIQITFDGGDFATRYFSASAVGSVQFATELVLTLLPFLKPRCVSWRYGAVTDGAQVFDDSVLLIRCQQG